MTRVRVCVEGLKIQGQQPKNIYKWVVIDDVYSAYLQKTINTWNRDISSGRVIHCKIQNVLTNEIQKS